MKAGWKVLLAAAACLASACSPAMAGDPPLAPVETPEIAIDPKPPEEDFRASIDQMMRAAEVGGVPFYAQVSQDFPEEYAALVDAVVAGLQAGKSEDEVGREGFKFSMTLKEKYNARMKDAGPAAIRALIVSGVDMLRYLREDIGSQACDDALAAYNQGTGTLTVGATPEGQGIYAANARASWVAMKAGLSSPQPSAPPTVDDMRALASAAMEAGAPESAVEAWWTGRQAPSGLQCDLAIGILEAELAMPGPAGERVRAASTLGLPPAKP